MLHARRPLSEAERYLTEAARFAIEHHLPEVAARSRFGLGGVLAQRGNLAEAVRSYQQAIALAQEAGDQSHEILGQ